MKRVRSWKALVALLGIAVVWMIVQAQGPAILPPFAATPFISAYSATGINAGFLFYGRHLNGTYDNGARVGLFNPFSWMAGAENIASFLSEGLGNLMAAPGGPPNVGRASQMFCGGKYSLSGNPGGAFLKYSATSTVFVVYASSSFTYSGMTSYPVGKNVSSLICADFNGDSVIDIAVTYQGDLITPGGVSILLNKGDSTFNPMVNYPVGVRPAGFSTLDINHDGVLDLAVTDGSSSSVYVLIGNANGTFNAATAYPIGFGSSNSVTIADFNGDGSPDLAVASGFTSGNVAILFNNGNGTFHAGSTIIAGGNATFIAAGDFNGDMKMDLAVVDQFGQTVSMYLGSGNGNFQKGLSYATSPSPNSLVLTDFDHDGILDVLVASGDARMFGGNRDSGNIDVLRSRGDGTFRGLPVAGTGIQASVYFTVVGDFNNDGKLDAIIPDFFASNGKNLYLFAGDGNGGFAVTPTILTLAPQGIPFPYGGVGGDFNGDGKTDLAIAMGNDGTSASKVAIFLNNGSGLGVPTTFSAAENGLTGIATGDFDGDGKLDLAVTGAGQNSGVAIFHGGGNGTFQLVQTFRTGSQATKVIAADLNGDGRPELVVADSGFSSSIPPVAGAIYILKNNGSGGFAAPVAVSLGPRTNPINVAAGDVNGDGKMDLALTITGANFVYQVAIVKGNGDTKFQSATFLSTDVSPQELAVGDFNGDGKADIVVAHATFTSDMTYFQGNGDGTFPAEVHFNGTSFPWTVAVVDLNKDGAPDIVVGGNNGQVAGLLNSSANFPCSYQLDKTSLSPSQQGGTFVVNIDAGPACNWSLTGLPDWITVSGASSGTGPGTVTLLVAPTSVARNATLSIAGISVNVAQTLAPVCNYVVYPGGQTFSSSGGTGNFTVTVNPGCAWTVTGNPSWITINSGSNGNGALSGTFTASANNGSARTATMTIGGQTFVLEQAASALPGLAAAGSLAQVVSQGGWKFLLNEVNLGSSPATARLNFYDNGSNPLLLPLTFPQSASALTNGAAALSISSPLLASTLDRTINPNAQLIVESTGTDAAAQQIGWGEFLTTGSVSGFGIFSFPALHWEAVVPLETRNASSYFLAFDNTGQLATGLAIGNVSAQSISVPVIIRDDTGAQIASGSIPLGGKGHTSFMLNEQFTAANGKRGTVEIQTPSGAQITVLGLRANGPALTTLPVLANVTNAGGLIAHATYNGGFTSIYYITNTGTSAADFTLSFFTEADGSPLQVPLLLPQTGGTANTSALTRTIAPKAMLVVQTQAVDALASVSGSAQLTTTGNISGFEIFQWTTFGQEASVPLETRTPTSFLMAFDNTGGLTTGVALSSAASVSVSVPVTLRDDTGALLQSTSIALPARGHTSFLLPDVYPSVASKRGLVEFTVPSGNRITVVGLRAKADGTLTTIPVLVK